MTTGRSTKINDDNKFAGQFGRRLYIYIAFGFQTLNSIVPTNNEINNPLRNYIS